MWPAAWAGCDHTTGGMAMTGTGEVRFLQHGTPNYAAITLDEPDFHTEYDEGKRIWTASWKWSGDQPLVSLKNRLSEYPTPKRLQGEYKQELQAWIQNSSLVPCPEDELGPPKGLIPLMAIVQENKQKVRLAMDYRVLNKHVEAYTAVADVCAHKLREWRGQGSDIGVRPAPSLLTNTLKDHCGRFKPWKLRGQDTALPDWDLVSTWLLTSWRQSRMRSKCRTRTFKRQHHPTLITSSSMNILCLLRRSKTFWAFRVDMHGDRASPKWGESARTTRQRSEISSEEGGATPDVPPVITRRSTFSVCGKLVSDIPVWRWRW